MPKRILENRIKEIQLMAEDISEFSGMQNNLAIKTRAKKIIKLSKEIRKKLLEIKVVKKQ